MRLLRASVAKGGSFDRHPILVPGSIFFVCWIPYLVIFFRRGIRFGDVGGTYLFPDAMYWALFAIQIGVCVISHSLTIRTIVRLWAPNWLIWGSIAFFSLSPAWGLLTAADIRHPLFAAVFCVFVSSATFALYSARTTWWLWVQLAGGALCVCLLRSNGIWAVAPALVAILAFEAWKALRSRSDDRKALYAPGERLGTASAAPVNASSARSAASFLPAMHPDASEKAETRWSDAGAAFLVLSAVGLLVLLSHCLGWGLPLGEPSFGKDGALAPSAAFGANLTGSNDVAGILPFADIAANSVFPGIAEPVAQLFYAQQCFPAVDLTFSWAAYLVLFACFAAYAAIIWVRSLRRGKGASAVAGHGGASTDRSGSASSRAPSVPDPRPLIIAVPMIGVLIFMAFVPEDATLRYMMPVLAAQPMLFGACIFSGKALALGCSKQ